MLLAADIPENLATPAQVGVWLVCLVVAVKGYNEIRSAVLGLKPERPVNIAPSPLTVRAHEEFVNKTEFLEAMKRVEGDINDVRSDLATNLKDSNESRRRLYARVDEVAAQFNGAIQKVNDRIDNIPDRVIAQLSNLHLLKTPRE
jgi:Mg2+ and Co2+ transporter CorA